MILIVVNSKLLYFQPTMKASEGYETTEKFTIDTEYFIQIAIQKEISWKSLAFMLTDLTTTLNRSKQVIRVLVQEIEKLASKLENQSNHKVLTNTINTKQVLNVGFEEPEENFDNLDSSASEDDRENLEEPEDTFGNIDISVAEDESIITENVEL